MIKVAEEMTWEEFLKREKEFKILNKGDIEEWRKYTTYYYQRTDKPMTCCGMQEGYGFHYLIPDKVTINTRYGEGQVYVDIRGRKRTKEELKATFTLLLNQSKFYSRNCTLVSLSSEQGDARAAAEELGFVKVHEFFNPNSSNRVALYTHTQWEDYDDYRRKNG